MRVPRCHDVRPHLSALLDGELADDVSVEARRHLEACAACRHRAEALASVRASVRLGVAEPVPDLTADIMARVAQDGTRLRRRDRRFSAGRTFAVAAVVAALVVAGASAPWRNWRGDAASAADIVRAVRRASQTLSTYRATFRISERGWHPDVPQRRFRAEVSFAAPERFRLEVDDLTTYPDPGRWPQNDVTFVASPDRVRVRTPSRCPVAALPGCTSGAPEERTLTERAPFDGRVVLPTDIVVPLETLAGAEAFEIQGFEVVAGRPAQRIHLELRRALPLVSALQQGGSWRSFHPLDDVRLWLDTDTWFPLGFDVVAGDSPDREGWAAANGYRDRPGEILFRVRATDFSEPDGFGRGFFSARAAGVVTSGRFRPEKVPGGWPVPRDVAGLTPYRSGRSGRSVVHAYASGTTWLRITFTRTTSSRAPSPETLAAEEVPLPRGGWAYYRPAGSELRREVNLFGSEFSARVEGNLPRVELLRIGDALGLSAERLPRVTRGPGGIRTTRLEPAAAVDRVQFAAGPARLPRGYEPARPDAALLVRSRRDAPSLVLHYLGREAEYDGVGIRIVQTPGHRLPPTAGAPSAVAVGRGGRYFAERGELEWIEEGVYHSIRAPSFDLATLVDIARGMR